MEADLLRKLQETQQNEKTAFSKLESAMVDASIPKKMRKLGSSQGRGTSAASSISQAAGRHRSTDPVRANRVNKSLDVSDRPTATR
jgi:hypothetical protein